MLEKLEAVYEHFKEIELLLSSPEVSSDMKRFTKLNKEYRDLEEVVEGYFQYKKLTAWVSFKKKYNNTNASQG